MTAWAAGVPGLVLGGARVVDGARASDAEREARVGHAGRPEIGGEAPTRVAEVAGPQMFGGLAARRARVVFRFLRDLVERRVVDGVFDLLDLAQHAQDLLVGGAGARSHAGRCAFF